jgi:hypothetical protein
VNESASPDRPAPGRPASRSLPARIVAASFIGLILVGNCLFAFRVIGHEIPAWLRLASRLATAGVVGGGLVLAGSIVWSRLRGRHGSSE